MNESSALLLAEVSTLREQLTALREENQSVKRKGAVDELVRSGRISPAEVALAEKAWNQAQSGDDAFWAMFNERKAGSVVSLREVGHGASGEQINRETLADRAKQLAAEKSISFSEALNTIRTTDREFFLAAMEG
jgi:phage I-like protein